MHLCLNSQDKFKLKKYRIWKGRSEEKKKKGYENINNIYNYISKIGIFKFHNMIWG